MKLKLKSVFQEKLNKNVGFVFGKKSRLVWHNQMIALERKKPSYPMQPYIKKTCLNEARPNPKKKLLIQIHTCYIIYPTCCMYHVYPDVALVVVILSNLLLDFLWAGGFLAQLEVFLAQKWDNPTASSGFFVSFGRV